MPGLPKPMRVPVLSERLVFPGACVTGLGVVVSKHNRRSFPTIHTGNLSFRNTQYTSTVAPKPGPYSLALAARLALIGWMRVPYK